jgi:hypothetical protein
MIIYMNKKNRINLVIIKIKKIKIFMKILIKKNIINMKYKK